VQGQNSADVRVLELDRTLRPAAQQGPQPLVVLRLVDRNTGQFVAQHREVIGDGGFDLVA
jgi:hypothetical protein